MTGSLRFDRRSSEKKSLPRHPSPLKFTKKTSIRDVKIQQSWLWMVRHLKSEGRDCVIGNWCSSRNGHLGIAGLQTEPQFRVYGMDGTNITASPSPSKKKYINF